MFVRRLAVVAVLGVTALAMTGCLPLAPSVQGGRPALLSTESFGPFTVDDGYGDTWTYTVAGLEANPGLASGTVPTGMQAFAVINAATHDAGSSLFVTCFDVRLVSGNDSYDAEETWMDYVPVKPAFHQDSGFDNDRVVVVVPEGTSPSQWVMSSRFGDDVRDFTFTV